MTSQISTRKLLTQQIRQNGWMFGLSGLIHLLTGPVVFLLYTSSYKNWSPETAAIRYNNFLTDNFFIWQLMAMLGCLFITIFVYRYLFSRRMVDLYHSVPISRSRLFLVKYLHGLFVWIIPFALNVGTILLFYIIRTAGQPFFWNCLGKFILLTLLLIFCYLIFYHLFLTAVYLSGNALNMMTNILIIGCIVISMVMLILSCGEYFFETYCFDPPAWVYDILFATSPAVTPFSIYGFLLSGSLTKHMLILIVSVFSSLILLYTAWRLCMNRPSELAERGTDEKIYSIISKISASLVSGIAGALFFSSISAKEQILAWAIFGALLCSIVCFGALNSIYKTTIKAFFRNRLQIGISVVASILIVITFQQDLLGYDSYLPKKEEISGMAIYSNQFTDGSSYITNWINSYGTTIKDTREGSKKVTQQKLLTDKDACFELLETFVNYDSDNSYINFYAKVELNNGRTYERSYKISNEDYLKLKPFIESEEYVNNNYKFSLGSLGYPQSITLEFTNTNVELDPSTNDLAESIIRKLMDAYAKDFEEHFSLENTASQMRIFSFSGRYPLADGSTYFSLDVPADYQRTLDVLKQHYPEHNVTIASADEIRELIISTDYYYKSNTDEYTLEGLYEYFGYDVETKENASESGSDNSGESETVIVEIAASEGYTIPATTLEYYSEIEITDTEDLEQLFPILHFGYYRDLLDMNDYIFVGYARTAKGFSKDCYVKPGTMPKEVIEQLFESKQSY